MQLPFKITELKSLLRFLLTFGLVYASLVLAYFFTSWREQTTDFLLSTLGKLCAQTTTEALTVFYYVNAPGEGLYEQVTVMVAKKEDIDAYNIATRQEKKHIDFERFLLKTNELGFFPIAMVLALTTAMPAPIKRKAVALPIAFLVTYLFVLAKWFVFIQYHASHLTGMPLVYFAFNATALFDGLNRIMNEHMGFTLMIGIMISVLTSFRKSDWAKFGKLGDVLFKQK